MITVPEVFAFEQIQQRGSDGSRWVKNLPRLVHEFCGRWGLELSEQPARYGAHALVLLCVQGSEARALKLGWDPAATATEATALRAWGGVGAVRLIDSGPDDGVMLLEGLDPSRSLESVDLAAAAEEVGRLIRRLAIAAPSEGPYADGWADLAGHLARQQAVLGAPLPQPWVDLASELAVGLLASPERLLLHTDLHSANVLAGRAGEWVAIDPRVSIGDPERSAPDLLLWRLPLDASPEDVLDALSRMTAAGDLRRAKVEQWMIVRAVGHWLWCVEQNGRAGPGTERCSTCKPRCRRILEALTE